MWLCGGSMEVLPCSRVAHIARMKKPYHSNIAFHTRRNALRVAEVWMDEYKSNVYLAWNIPVEVRDDVDANICAPLLFFLISKLHMNNVSHMADNKNVQTLMNWELVESLPWEQSTDDLC